MSYYKHINSCIKLTTENKIDLKIHRFNFHYQNKTGKCNMINIVPKLYNLIFVYVFVRIAYAIKIYI